MTAADRMRPPGRLSTCAPPRWQCDRLHGGLVGFDLPLRQDIAVGDGGRLRFLNPSAHRISLRHIKPSLASNTFIISPSRGPPPDRSDHILDRRHKKRFCSGYYLLYEQGNFVLAPALMGASTSRSRS